jgi:hypothetical protein
MLRESRVQQIMDAQAKQPPGTVPLPKPETSTPFVPRPIPVVG